MAGAVIENWVWKVLLALVVPPLVLCVCLLASCGTSSQGSSASASSASASSSVDDTAQRYKAYYAKCQEYSTIYGAPSTSSYYNSYGIASGLALVRLVDFDGDGADELLLGYITSDLSANAMEVWSYRAGGVEQDFAGNFSLHGSNGYFPYVEVLGRSDGDGAALSIERCYGSAPYRKADELYGYAQDGTFGALARRALESLYETSYYICPVEVDTYWRSEEWREVSEGEYEEAFTSICGGRALHLHLFELPQGDGGMCDSDSHLDDTIGGTRETISFLAKYAG